MIFTPRQIEWIAHKKRELQWGEVYIAAVYIAAVLISAVLIIIKYPVIIVFALAGFVFVNLYASL